MPQRYDMFFTGVGITKTSGEDVLNRCCWDSTGCTTQAWKTGRKFMGKSFWRWSWVKFFKSEPRYSPLCFSLYRPLSFRIIDCRAVIGIHQSYRVGYQRIRHRLVEVYLFRDAQLFMLLQQSQQSVFIFLRHILSTIISLSLAIWVLSTALLVLYFFHKMYFPSIHCISGIVLTISSTSSSFITDLQAVLLMALAISLILTGTLK